MEIPNTIIEFYNVLEENRTYGTMPAIKKLPITESLDDEWKIKIITERKILNLEFRNGQYKPYLSTNIKGEVIDLKILNDNEIEYIESRVSETNNPYLKAKYSHILWQETRHNTSAKVAIKSYLEIIQLNNLSFYFSTLKFLISIVNKTKIQKSEIKDLILQNFNNLPVYLKRQVLELVVELRFYKNIELKNILLEIPKWIDSQYFLNKSILELGIKLYPKVNLSTDNLYLLLAKNEDIILEQHKEEMNFVYLSSLGKKKEYLKKSNAKKLYEEASNEFTRIKPQIKLESHKVELNADIHLILNKFAEFYSDELLKYSCDKILGYFSVATEVIVNSEEIEEYAKKNFNDSITSLFSVIAIDININPKNLTKDQAFLLEKFRSYDLNTKIIFYSVFYLVFLKGIERGKITYSSVLDFFRNNTWYVKKFKRTLNDNNIEENADWISLLAPGIHSFFSQFQTYVLFDESQNIGSKYILSIDSLTLKFEGALRDFIRLSGGNTTIEKKGVLQEQLLEELLRNEKTEQYFTKDEIELFKFTFTKSGRDLRNKIAHSFMRYSDYSFEVICFVFLCFLRLGKYK